MIKTTLKAQSSSVTQFLVDKWKKTLFIITEQQDILPTK